MTLTSFDQFIVLNVNRHESNSVIFNNPVHLYKDPGTVSLPESVPFMFYLFVQMLLCHYQSAVVYGQSKQNTIPNTKFIIIRAFSYH